MLNELEGIVGACLAARLDRSGSDGAEDLNAAGRGRHKISGLRSGSAEACAQFKTIHPGVPVCKANGDGLLDTRRITGAIAGKRDLDRRFEFTSAMA